MCFLFDFIDLFSGRDITYVPRRGRSGVNQFLHINALPSAGCCGAAVGLLWPTALGAAAGPTGAVVELAGAVGLLWGCCGSTGAAVGLPGSPLECCGVALGRLWGPLGLLWGCCGAAGGARIIPRAGLFH